MTRRVRVPQIDENVRKRLARVDVDDPNVHELTNATERVSEPVPRVNTEGQAKRNVTHEQQAELVLGHVLSNRMPFGVVVRAFRDLGSN